MDNSLIDSIFHDIPLYSEWSHIEQINKGWSKDKKYYTKNNIGSAKVMEKIGMKKEGHLREHKFQKGKWRDSFIYSILDYEQEFDL